MQHVAIFHVRHLGYTQLIGHCLDMASVAGRLIVDVGSWAGVAAVLVRLADFKRLESCGNRQGADEVFGGVDRWFAHTLESMRIGWLLNSLSGTRGVL
jgi:hypothetical protein